MESWVGVGSGWGFDGVPDVRVVVVITVELSVSTHSRIVWLRGLPADMKVSGSSAATWFTDVIFRIVILVHYLVTLILIDKLAFTHLHVHMYTIHVSVHLASSVVAHVLVMGRRKFHLHI